MDKGNFDIPKPTNLSSGEVGHSGNVTEPWREKPVETNVPPLTEDAVETTDIPENPHAGFGGEAVVLSPAEKALIDQARAGVQARHTPDHDSSLYSEAPKKKSKKGRIIGGVVSTLVVVTGAAIGLSHKGDTNEDGAVNPDQPKPEATAPVTPGVDESNPATPAPSAENPASTSVVMENGKFVNKNCAQNLDVSEPPFSLVECNNFSVLPLEEQEKLLSYEKMTIPDFLQLPMPEQIRFGRYVINNNAARMMPYFKNIYNFDRELDPIGSLNNTAQEIADQTPLKRMAATGFLMEDHKDGNGYVLNKDLMQKTLSYYVMPGTTLYDQYAANIQQLNGNRNVQFVAYSPTSKPGEVPFYAEKYGGEKAVTFSYVDNHHPDVTGQAGFVAFPYEEYIGTTPIKRVAWVQYMDQGLPETLNK